MRQRSFSITFLILTFVLSAWGNVIAAAFCPRYASNRNCCIKQIVSQPTQPEQSSCHHEMTGMAMGEMQMEPETSDSQNDLSTQTSPSSRASESSSVQDAVDLPIEQCLHCVSHSQPTSGTAAIIPVDQSKQPGDIDSPVADSRFALASGSPSCITPSEHSPPGSALPRHILINVFRI
jgi:hypothetical protein